MSLRIRALRKAKGLTGEQLGEMVGVSKGYISEMESGKKTPGAGLVIRLADALGVSVADLYEGDPATRERAAMAAHLEVMEQLPPEDRQAIEKAALGLLAKHLGSS